MLRVMDNKGYIEDGGGSIRSKASSWLTEDTESVRRMSDVSLQDTDSKSQNATTVTAMEDGPTERQLRAKRMKTACCSFVKSCSSNLGLMCAVIGYSLLGGYIFHILEEGNERNGCVTRRNEYSSHEAETINRLIDIASTDGDWNTTSQSYKKLLSRFRETLYKVDYTGDNCSMIGMEGGPNLEWSISGATMFAVTITTTIGYGHISPQTFWGKMVCIAYAVLGIPLMLLFLSNIGEVLADFFKFFYTRVCCCGCLRLVRQRDEEEAVDVADLPEESESKKETESELDEEEEYGDDDNITIPLTITIGVIAGYVMLGALLFKIWEKWTPGDAAYFSFITLSTVGFGDFVPGSQYDDPNREINLIMGAVYMILGMAILSMCFALIQDEIAAKFAWIGQKLGLADKKEEEYEQ